MYNYETKCNKEDISSFSNFEQFRQQHIHINNRIDFENKRYTLFYYLIKDFLGMLKFNLNSSKMMTPL